ncbi:type IV pilus modification protein PilV [Rhabdochromatium marinum]|uniref:type IV pilus modification protein PilV n=1 Tax=Rhabdochromatium marinum TaxID=48729 RepID=UPI001904977B|nr:type IV pilus modification protein PilV [Rhabdochromatium marinum]MBK1647899.1 type IV pilus modification protein PilV [Rhabdochromatium marinum]
MIIQCFIPNRLKQQGFTLIEVLIAALVLAIGLLGLAGLQAVSLKMSQGSYLRVQATNLAYEIADSIRANKSNASDYAGTFTTTCNQTLTYASSYSSGTEIAVADLAVWQNRLACLLPGGSGTIAVSDTTPTITVTWVETRFEGEETDGSDTTQSFTFTTEL